MQNAQNRQFVPKMEGCPKGRRQPPSILRQNSRFGVGLKRPNQKRANHQFVPKKRGGLLYGILPDAGWSNGSSPGFNGKRRILVRWEFYPKNFVGFV